MSLELLTGPANAQKAGAVLDRVRAFADAGVDPMLVVPTAPDAVAYRRELAADGRVFGLTVVTFAELRRELAARAGTSADGAGRVTRERIAAGVAAATRLESLADAASTAGFASAFTALCDELGEHRIGPGLWHTAMRAWAAASPEREAYALELAQLYGAYRDRLTAFGGDPSELTHRAVSVLLEEPRRWGERPVLFYGFDDLTPIELDTVKALGRIAPVTVSLPFEEGRDDLYRSRARAFGDLAAVADRHERLPALAEHYAAASRSALHHLERALFEPPGERPDPGDAVGLLDGGGERAELELLAEEVRLMIAGGIAPEDIAVALRDAESVGPLLERVFTQAGVSIALERRVPLGHTALGRALIAMLRAALPTGTAADFLVWLRLPGRLDKPQLADELEARVRREGLASAAQAHAAWKDLAHYAYEQLDELAALADRPARLYDRLAYHAQLLLVTPWREQAALLSPAGEADARALEVARGTLAELAALARADPTLAPTPAELVDLLDAQEVRVGRAPGPGLVTVARPLRLRARRMRVLLLGRLQEGIFPSPGSPDPFLGDAERLAVNAAGGLRLRLGEDRLDAERWLLYSAISRPTERLVLSSHRGDDDGEPSVRSLFVDDILECFAPELAERATWRPLGQIGFARSGDGEGGGAVQQRLAAALAQPGRSLEPQLGPLTDEAVLEHIAARDAWGARLIEQWHSCPSEWFVDWLLRPEELEPESMYLVRGGLQHSILQRVFEALDGPLGPANVDAACALARREVAREAPTARLVTLEQYNATLLRRVEADIVRYLRAAAQSETSYRPDLFELSFGTRDGAPAVELAPGVRVTGRIDRIDRSPTDDTVIIVDYKGRTRDPTHAQARWVSDGVLQAGIYALAVPQLVEGVRVAGALYQPIGAAKDQRPRGFVEQGADPDRTDIVRNDRVDADGATALLDGVAQLVAAAVGEMRGGQVVSRPATCANGRGCANPAICRCDP
ncbi:MAG: hypothetical protein F2832_07840 [Actinobacteria bacterium]|nr:hypothetical protein [Actinomycetota bacterium]